MSRKPLVTIQSCVEKSSLHVYPCEDLFERTCNQQDCSDSNEVDIDRKHSKASSLFKKSATDDPNCVYTFTLDGEKRPCLELLCEGSVLRSLSAAS